MSFIGSIALMQGLIPLNNGLIYGTLLSIPFSTTSFISFQRLLRQGNIAGFTSFLGAITGECFFIGLILFGVQPLIQVWVSWFPTIFCIGTLLSIKILFEFILSPFQKQVEFSNRIEILKIFLISFFLTFSNISLIDISHLIFDSNFIDNNFYFTFLIGICLSEVCFASLICLFTTDLIIKINNIISRYFYFSIRKFAQFIGYIGISLLLQASLNFPWNGYLNYFITYSPYQTLFNENKPDSRFPKFKKDFQKRYKLSSSAQTLPLSFQLLTNFCQKQSYTNLLNDSGVPVFSESNRSLIKSKLKTPLNVKTETSTREIENKNYKEILTSKVSNIGAQNVNRYDSLKIFHKVERVAKPIWRKGELSNLLLYKDFYFFPTKSLDIIKYQSKEQDPTDLTSFMSSQTNLLNQYFSKNYYLLLQKQQDFFTLEKRINLSSVGFEPTLKT